MVKKHESSATSNISKALILFGGYLRSDGTMKRLMAPLLAGRAAALLKVTVRDVRKTHTFSAFFRYLHARTFTNVCNAQQ